MIIYPFLALQRKLGNLLSFLSLDCGISTESLSKTLQENAYFDFFETGKTKDFLDSPLEKIYEELYGFRSNGISRGYMASELLWAGSSYMAISLLTHRPLRQVFFVLPLKSLLALYEPYHEMGERQILERYKVIEEDENVLSLLLNKKGMTPKEFALLADIPYSNVLRYFKDKAALWRASFQVVEKMAYVLDESLSMFKERSLYLHYGASTFGENKRKDDEFASLLLRLSSLRGEGEEFGEDDELIYCDYSLSEDEIRETAKKERFTIFFFVDGTSAIIDMRSGLIERQGEKKTSILFRRIYGTAD